MISGKFSNKILLSTKKFAAKIGRAAFLLAETVIFQDNHFELLTLNIFLYKNINYFYTNYF